CFSKKEKERVIVLAHLYSLSFSDGKPRSNQGEKHCAPRPAWTASIERLPLALLRGGIKVVDHFDLRKLRFQQLDLIFDRPHRRGEDERRFPSATTADDGDLEDRLHVVHESRGVLRQRLHVICLHRDVELLLLHPAGSHESFVHLTLE